MALVGCLSAYSQAQSQGFTWDFVTVTRDTHGKETSETISYSVNSEITKIEDGQEIISIDYSQYVLYRYNKSERSCLKFPLYSSYATEPADPKENSREKSIALVGSLKRITTTERKEIGPYKCSLQHILFGAQFAVSQMVASPVIQKFNQQFTESMVSYWVSNEVLALSPLLTISQKRRPVYQNNPLLRQVDIVGLLEILEGFPVQSRYRFREVESVMTLLNKPSATDDNNRFVLADECIAKP